MELPRKICEGCINSIEKNVQNVTIFAMKNVKISAEYPMKNVE